MGTKSTKILINKQPAANSVVDKLLIRGCVGIQSTQSFQPVIRLSCRYKSVSSKA